MSSTDLVINPIAIPPALREAGVTVVEQEGVRTVHIPAAMQATHNVVQPVSEMTQADPDWSPRLVVVDLSGEQYSYTEQRKQALTKNGILLLAHAAGLDVEVEMIPRAQLRDTEVGYKATAKMRRSDGTLARWEASKVGDLADETTPIGRTHLPAKTESKAILRAVSLALQLKRGGYEKSDLQKPFLIVGVSFTPSDPEVRRERALQAGSDLYGKRALAAVPDETSQYEDPAPAQIAPPADVVDIKPSAPVEPPVDEEPVRGEIPADVHAAGEHVFPDSFTAKGKKVSEVRATYLEHQAYVRQFTPQEEPTVQACRVYARWLKAQEASA